MQTVWTDRKNRYLEETGGKKGELRKLPWHLILMKADASDKNKCLLGRKAKVCLADIKTGRWHVQTELRGRENATNREAAQTTVQLSPLSYSFTEHWDPVSLVALHASRPEGCGFDPQLP